MLSKKEEKEINYKMDELADEYMRGIIGEPDSKDVENLSFVFTYKQNANLVKYSRSLTIWTIIIAISTILLFFSAVITLVDRLCDL